MQTTSKKHEARVHLEPGFAWDAQDAYLFDIDGTLLRNPDRVHFNAFASSIQRVTGFEISLAGVTIHGGTDTAILREACLQASVPFEILEPQFEAILEAIRQTVADQRHTMELVLMPGVKETLHYLASKGALLGVATGNLETIGWIKIEEAGLREWFRFGGFSDRFPIRSELVGHAALKARELTSATARVCVVGDTPRDVQAAHINGLPVIAVATGHYSFDELLEDHPEVCATSLADLLAQTQDGS